MRTPKPVTAFPGGALAIRHRLRFRTNAPLPAALTPLTSPQGLTLDEGPPAAGYYTNLLPKQRPCLMCGLHFLSDGSGQRICGKCKGTSAWRNGLA